MFGIDVTRVADIIDSDTHTSIDDVYHRMNQRFVPCLPGGPHDTDYDKEEMTLSGLVIYYGRNDLAMRLFDMGERVGTMAILASLETHNCTMVRLLAARSPDIREWLKREFEDLSRIGGEWGSIVGGTMRKFAMVYALADAAGIDPHGAPHWMSTTMIYRAIHRPIAHASPATVVHWLIASGARIDDAIAAGHDKAIRLARNAQNMHILPGYRSTYTTLWHRHGLFGDELKTDLWTSGQHPVLRAQRALTEAASEWMPPDVVADLARCVVVPPRKSAPGDEHGQVPKKQRL